MYREFFVTALWTLIAGLVGAGIVCLLPGLRLRIFGLVLLAAILPVAAVVRSGLVMIEGHDLKIFLLSALASLAALVGAVVIVRSITRPVDRLRDAAGGISGGDLAARAPLGGVREFDALARSFNEMAGNVESLFEGQRQFVTAASHDLRTPLASMQATVEALQDGIGDHDRYLAALHEQVGLMTRLVNDLLDLSRLEADSYPVDLEPCDLGELVAASVRAYAPDADARGVSLVTRCPGGLPAARCAPEQVERIVGNLVANALRHTPRGGEVAVDVEPVGSHLCVRITDTGEGLPPGSHDRLFEPFVRGDSSRSRDTGGTGLGLAIVSGLVELHGGRIWAADRPGGGAEFAFTLPRA